MERAAKAAGGGHKAALFADNMSWGAAFLVAGPTANLRRAGGDANPRPNPGRVSAMQWSHLEAPAYLLKRRDDSFLHVQHQAPPVGIPARPASSGLGAPPTRTSSTGAPAPASAAKPETLLALRKALLKEMGRVMDTFQKMDTNRDGKVRLASTSLRDATPHARPTRLLWMPRWQVSLSEFRQVLPLVTPKRKRPPASEVVFSAADVDALFESIDKDGSGAIEYKELNAVLRQGLNVTLSKDMQVGAQGEITTDAKNKVSLRGAKPRGGTGGGEAGGEAGSDDANGTPTIDPLRTGVDPLFGASADGSDPFLTGLDRGASPPPPSLTASTTNVNKPPTYRPPFAYAGTQKMVVAPPLVGAAQARSGKLVISTNLVQTWYAVPGKNDFLLHPLRAEEVLPQQQANSKLWQSVQLVRQKSSAVSLDMHHTHALHSLHLTARVKPSRRHFGGSNQSSAALGRSGSSAMLGRGSSTVGGLSESKYSFMSASDAEEGTRARHNPIASASAPHLKTLEGRDGMLPSYATIASEARRASGLQSDMLAPAPWAPPAPWHPLSPAGSVGELQAASSRESRTPQGAPRPASRPMSSSSLVGVR